MGGRNRVVVVVAAVVLALAAVAVGVVALTREDPPTSAIATAEVVREQLDDGATVIDVRTPEEYDAGHVVDAVPADLEGGDFDGVVSDLPREAAYVVYCASGRRAAVAVDRMIEAGFTDVVNGGGLEDMTALGVPLEEPTGD
jgi:phage shock protein E